MKRILSLMCVLAVAGCGWSGGGGGGGTAITSTLAFTGTATTNSITSDTTAATATSSIAAITMAPTAVLGANDLVVEVNSSAGTSLMSVDLEGDVLTGGTITSTGDIVPAADLTYYLGTDALSWLGMRIRNIYDEADSLRLNFAANAKTSIRGQQANGSSAVGVIMGPNINYTTAGASLAVFSNNGLTTDKARVDLNGFYLQPAQTVTVADDAAGTAPATNITPSSNLILIAYNDATNASVGTLSETGAQEGTRIAMVHTGTGGTVVFTESAGVQEIGATACTLGLSDTATAVYANSSWHFLTCRDN